MGKAQDDLSTQQRADMLQLHANPVPKAYCKCGCGRLFQPGRKDQTYINRQHANFGYNHGLRKTKQKEERKVEKQLRLNDKILAKYFNLGDGKVALCYTLQLKKDGFDMGHFTGISGTPDERYFLTYNFMFHVYTKDGYNLVKIIKK